MLGEYLISMSTIHSRNGILENYNLSIEKPLSNALLN